MLKNVIVNQMRTWQKFSLLLFFVNFSNPFVRNDLVSSRLYQMFFNMILGVFISMGLSSGGQLVLFQTESTRRPFFTVFGQ